MTRMHRDSASWWDIAGAAVAWLMIFGVPLAWWIAVRS